MKISFLGATKMVTGSNFLIETKNTKFLIDCGLFQGSKSINRMNYEPFNFNPEEIDLWFYLMPTWTTAEEYPN